ncbi:uncharacterized protein F4807DRAFT_462902 [Annulohypoxylon truncatum]|uniref:uncharacterized protein n=1 Tax=Annulohypoxylon truncatum TaxID=327061 RepID=UPI002007EC4F|nr:uncharacterized protein F4807DRAFT_462902 [Annulohypoxylon truncatum]KAI1207172.1 hypothetical protein F4807DRAFT_462902 [Annulohypoxylon truncatum]
MILSRSGMVINTASGTGPSPPPPPPSQISSTGNVQPPVDPLAGNNKGKKKAVARKPWADEPWPLIEPLSRTQSITHPAHHIADELSHTHNAMLRGLNALYLQAPFVRDPIDVADFLFLAQAWSGWVLDYHEMKENIMIPGFEAALGLRKGSLGEREDDFSTRSREYGDINDDMDSNKPGGEETGKGEEEDAETKSQSLDLPTHIQNLRSYAIETHPQPSSYSPSTLRTLLTTLASTLVPHLHNQTTILLQMEELSALPPSNSPFPSLPSLPSLPSPSPSPAPSQPSTLNSTSTPPSSTPSALSKSTTSTTGVGVPPLPSRPPPPPPPFSTTPTTTPSTPTGKAPPPSPRASSLTQVHLSAESSFSAAMDRYTVPPMAIRLRDAAHDGAARLSVPAIHAVADRLSPRHAGAWRFLPCDIWGRRRGLEFLGDGEGW